MMDQRPKLNNDISIPDFRAFYWLKKELVQFCRENNLKTSGGKIEIAKRIEHFLATGESKFIKVNIQSKASSKFDWHTAKLSLQTTITDNYKNTQNVRKFFETQLGKPFKFNVRFMNWMKSNSGKTLKDAIQEWERINTAAKNTNKPKNIAPQFEYNRYLRDFLADNPNLNRAVGIQLWNIKKKMRGDNVYQKEDLKWIDEQ